MAEGYTNALQGDTFQAYSAGVKAQDRVDPRAVQVMKEEGIDISHHRPKSLDTLSGISFDYVVTVCDNANESCPVFPGQTTRMHRSFEDPPRLTQGMAPDDALVVYRRVRDEIKRFVQSLPQAIGFK